MWNIEMKQKKTDKTGMACTHNTVIYTTHIDLSQQHKPYIVAKMQLCAIY